MTLDIQDLIDTAERRRIENLDLRDALGFYADPATYEGIGFRFPESGGGAFLDDFEQHTPGRLAREALRVDDHDHDWVTVPTVDTPSVRIEQYDQCKLCLTIRAVGEEDVARWVRVSDRPPGHFWDVATQKWVKP